MSAASAVVRQLLLARSQVTELVPAARVRIGEYPADLDMPGVLITEVSQSEQRTVGRRGAHTLERARVQVTVYGSTYEEQEDLLLAVKLGGGVHTGVIAGHYVNAVEPAGVGPAIPPGDEGIFERSRDFMVTFREAN